MDERREMKPEVFEELKKEQSELTMLERYLQNNGQENERFTSIRNLQSLSLADDSVVIPDIMVLEAEKSNTQIAVKRSKTYREDEIEMLSKNTGLEKVDIIDLLETGLQLQEIQETAQALPFKEISDSTAIREMVKQNIDPAHMSLLQEKGIQVVPLENGQIQVNSLEKLAELDAQDNVVLNKALTEQLQVFEAMGLINISEGLAMQEVEADEKEEEKEQESQEVDMTQPGSLRIVPLKEKQKEQTKDELERIKIAQSINEDPKNIISVIRLEENRTGGSQLLNSSLQDKANPVIIRLKGNKFIGAQELDNGEFQQLQGFEVTPVAKQLAASLKDTQSKHDTYLKPDEVQAGRTTENSNQDYTMFKIKMAGEKKGDDLNQLLFVGLSGEVDINLIENHSKGDVMFSKVPAKRIYPKVIYMENNKGNSSEKEIAKQDDGKESDFPTVGKGDISARREILDELLEVEERILSLEADYHISENTMKEMESQSGDPERDPERTNPTESRPKNDKAELSSLYTRRNELISKLGMSKATALKEVEKEDNDFIIGTPRQRPH